MRISVIITRIIVIIIIIIIMLLLLLPLLLLLLVFRLKLFPSLDRPDPNFFFINSGPLKSSL
jgi:hypothetical protein